MTQNHVTIYLYGGIIEQPKPVEPRLSDVRCMHCGQLLGRMRGRIFTVTNTQGASITEIPVGMPMFQVKCGRCNTYHNILWQ